MKYAAGRRRCVLRVLLGPRTAVCGLPVCHCLHTAQLGLGRSCLRPARARVSRTMDCHRLYCNTVYQAYLLPVFFFFQAYGSGRPSVLMPQTEPTVPHARSTLAARPSLSEDDRHCHEVCRAPHACSSLSTPA